MTWWVRLQQTLFIRIWGFLNVPMIHWLKPTVVEFSSEKVQIRLPLSRRSKNHLKSMYFGALCAGADIAGGILAMHMIKKKKLPINLVFSAVDAKFLKRAMGDTLFTCFDCGKIATLIQEAMDTGQRVSGEVNIIATCPEASGDEPVAHFKLSISLKKAK